MNLVPSSRKNQSILKTVSVHTGEKQNTTCKFCKVLCMKYSITFSCVRVRFGFSLFIIGVNSDTISACSSLVNKFEMTPENCTYLVFIKYKLCDNQRQ